MRKIRAFTLIEVMISIFIFTTAMLGYMSFHAHSMSVLFDNESAQFAHSLAFNLVEEMNAMSYDDFFSLVSDKFCSCDADKRVCNSCNNKVLADDTTLGLKNYFGADYSSNPFMIVKGAESYRFYRFVSIVRYKDKTPAFVQDGSYLSTLFHVLIEVRWPKRGHGDHDCTNYDEGACDKIEIPLVRSIRNR